MYKFLSELASAFSTQRLFLWERRGRKTEQLFLEAPLRSLYTPQTHLPGKNFKIFFDVPYIGVTIYAVFYMWC